MTRFEHANLTVPDIDAAIKFIKIVAPDFDVRKDERPSEGIRWVHIGNEEYYLALQEPYLDTEPKKRLKAYKNYGINHLALVVSNLQEIKKKLEWELIEYFSEKPSEKFLYE